MRTRDVHEDTPLLGQTCGDDAQERSKPINTPLPWRQLSILLLLLLAEPLTSQVIAPFLPQLIREIGITHGDDSRIGYYVGLVYSLFFISQACTVFLWSRASDQIGRRPIILIGLAGLSVPTYYVGLSRTFWGLVFSRCLSGALNGNVGVIKSMVTEITDSTNVVRAFSFVPMTWFLGVTIGPLIGGSLERPTERFPTVFGRSSFLKEYPYFLPCSISATFTAICWFIVFLSLNEVRLSHAPSGGSLAVVEDYALDCSKKPLSFRELLIAPVLVAAGSYASFAILDISFRTVLPVYLATPLELGGLGLDPPVIGTILAIIGISGGVFQLLFFPPLHNRLGGKNLFLMAISLFLPIAALFPITNRVGQKQGLNNLVWFLVGLMIFLFVLANLALGVTFVYVNGAAPNRASIGATNGLAQLLVSIVRAVGPWAVNSAFALGIQQHVMGGHFAYWVIVGMTAISLVIGVALPERPSNVHESARTSQS
ncbi:major facilitator superfamily domain-containing protein [Scleroderma yunnanense]